MCLSCYEIYDRDLIKTSEFDDYNFCPKSNCIGEVVEIDELLIPTIKILNQKGYYTKFCCSGHYYGQHPNGYISFEEGIDIPFLPKGFKKEVFNNCVTIRSTIKDKIGKRPSIKDFKTICNNAKILVEWAISLPYNDECLV
jgi:hypothetical protein